MNDLTVRDAVLRLLRAFGMTRSSATPARPSCRCSSISRRTSATCSACRNRSWSAWPTAMRRRRATPPSSTCIRRPASATRWATIFTAYQNRTPLVITAGQQARSILPFDPFLFSAQATELPKPYVKWSCEPARAEDVPLAIARAYYLAMQPPRGPVLVSIPPTTGRGPASPSRRARVSRAPRCDAARARRDRRGARCQRAAGLRRRRRRRPRRRLGRRACARRAPQRARVGRADVGALRLPRRSPAVRRLPAGDARADRRRCSPGTT